ncbi:MAG: phosphate signaling complex protein PhoU [Pseudomonadota bacterium]|jgi:phosphate transport system protein|nr:phosphate signaling complex protein PhoU [Pseudomonadota bacterium]
MDKSDYRQHISSQFNTELEDVRSRVLEMGGRVETQILDATRALVSLDGILASQVEAADQAINRIEVRIDEDCSQILVRRQPTAGDLRLVYAVIKTITDLERIGDEAAKIARMAISLAAKERTREHMLQVQHLSNQVRTMVHDALDAFARMDAEAAVAVARQDIVVDREYESLMRQLMTYMMEDVRTVGPVIDIIFCIRAMERIGDHAKNIAEYVVYLVKGKDVRHIGIDAMERQVLARPPDPAE